MKRIAMIEHCRMCNHDCGGKATLQYEIPEDCPLETLEAHDEKVRAATIDEMVEAIVDEPEESAIRGVRRIVSIAKMLKEGK